MNRFRSGWGQGGLPSHHCSDGGGHPGLDGGPALTAEVQDIRKASCGLLPWQFGTWNHFNNSMCHFSFSIRGAYTAGCHEQVQEWMGSRWTAKPPLA
jgi:hypothetical protein